MRVVIDTNVLVSGMLNANGSPGRVLDAVLIGDLHAVCDDRIVGEYRDVLARPKFNFEPAHRDRVLEFLRETAERVVAPPLSVVLPDSDDRPFLEVPAHAEAALITGNLRHFPQDQRAGVTVLTPAQAVAAWEQALTSSPARKE